MSRPHEQGAASSVWCATSPHFAGMGGVYCQNVDIAEILQPDSAINLGVLPRAIDPETADEELTGIKFEY